MRGDSGQRSLQVASVSSRMRTAGFFICYIQMLHQPHVGVLTNCGDSGGERLPATVYCGDSGGERLPATRRRLAASQ